MNLILHFSFMVFLSATASAFPEVGSFVETKKLETEFRAFCSKSLSSNLSPEITLRESATQHMGGVDFETVRFKMTLKKDKDFCTAERQIVQTVTPQGRRSSLYDSGFFAEPYCGDPVRLVQVPRVYNLELIADPNLKMARQLAVVEFVSSTLPCPDTDDLKSRHFVIYELENKNRILIDVEAEYVISEIGDDSYRLHLFNVHKVIESALKIPEGMIPYAIDLGKNGFQIESHPFEKTKSPKRAVSRK